MTKINKPKTTEGKGIKELLKNMFEYLYKLDMKLKLYGDGLNGECPICGLNPDKLFGEIEKLIDMAYQQGIKDARDEISSSIIYFKDYAKK